MGQRKGLGLALGHPAFVLEIRPETNEVVIGTYEESLTRIVRADRINFMAVEDLSKPKRVFAKIRYNHKGAWCTAEKTDEDEIVCHFEEPQRGSDARVRRWSSTTANMCWEEERSCETESDIRRAFDPQRLPYAY